MSAKRQLRFFYDYRWAAGRRRRARRPRGHLIHFRNWLHAELQDLPRDARILDAACGDASFTRHLAEYAPHVVALDVADGQIRRNAGRHPELNFLAHDLTDPLPFEYGSFDAVWCSEVLAHLFDPVFALRELNRVLVLGGRLLVTVPYHGLLKNLGIALWGWDRYFSPFNPHVKFFTTKSLAAAVRAAGFHIEAVRTCGRQRPLRDCFMPAKILLSATKR